MAERLSALAAVPLSSSDGARVTLREVRSGSILQVQVWPGRADALRRAVAELLVVDLPLLGETAEAEGLVIAAIAPGRFLLASAENGLAERLAAALPAADAAISDVTHGRVVLGLEGPSAEPLLQGCLMFDLDGLAFPPGRAAQGMIHHVDVVIHRRAATVFDLWTLRSFAQSLAEWLMDAAKGLRTPN